MAQRMARVEDALWGPWRDNGLVSDIKAIRKHQEEQAKASKNAHRSALVAMASAIVALLVALSTVIVMYQVAL